MPKTGRPRRPTREELLAAAGKTVPDLIAPGLAVLFVGINPGLYTAAIGHHFGRPGNRFWPALFEAGFTPRLLTPYEEAELLDLGLGITNLVARATNSAAELTADEFRRGRIELEEKVERFRPRWLAFVGIGAYRSAYQRPKAVVGQQEERVDGAGVWVLPNTSGLNANHKPAELASLFRQLKVVALPAV